MKSDQPLYFLENVIASSYEECRVRVDVDICSITSKISSFRDKDWIVCVRVCV